MAQGIEPDLPVKVPCRLQLVFALGPGFRDIADIGGFKRRSSPQLGGNPAIIDVTGTRHKVIG